MTAITTSFNAPPAIPTPRLSQLGVVPLELRELNQWVNWHYEWGGKKWTKVPLNPFTQRRASSTNPRTWAPWFQAVCLMRPPTTGLGLVFTKDDLYTGIDLDHCRDPQNGKIKGWALDILRRFGGAYVEVSISGTGLHLIVRARLPAKGRRKPTVGEGGIEVYDSGRFFVVTSEVWRDNC